MSAIPIRNPGHAPCLCGVITILFAVSMAYGQPPGTAPAAPPATTQPPDTQPTTRPALQPTPSIYEARKLLLEGKLDDAATMYEALSKNTDDEIEAACGLGEIALLRGTYEEGIARLKATEAAAQAGRDRRPAASADWHATMAALLAEVGRYEEAIEQNQTALRLDKRDLRARWQLGQMQEALGRRDEAIATYRFFEDIMTGNKLPESAEDLTWLGQGFLRHTVLTRHPDNVKRTRHVLTEVYQEAFDFVDAAYWPARLAAAELLLEKHNLQEAKGDFEHILELSPAVADAHVGIGRVALEDWGFEDAEKHVQAALKINPNHVGAHLLLADTRMTERKYAEAAKEAEKALKTNPRSIPALALIASAAMRRGDAAGCEEMERRITQINPHSAVREYVIGFWLSAGRQFAPAEVRFKKAIEEDPTWTEPRAALGQLYMEIGEEGQARRTLDAAFAMDSFNSHTHNVLELLDQLEEFDRLETEHFIIKFDKEKDGVAAPYFAEALEALQADVCDDFGVKLDKKTIIEIFPDHMGFSVRITGRPFIGTVGACSGRVIALTAPRGLPPFGRFNWAGVLRHEFTHTVTLAATQNRIPHWMTEGLSVYEETAPRSWNWKVMLSDAVRRGRLFTMESIDWGFMRPRRPDDRQLAYAQSEWMCEYIIERFKFEAIGKMLSMFREGAAQETVFETVLQVSTDDFSHAFNEWAKKQVAAWGLPAQEVEDPEKLQKLVDENDNDARLTARLAEALMLDGEYEEALETAKDALEIDAKEPKALETLCHLIIGKMLSEKEEATRRDLIDQADPYLRKLIKVQPDNAAAMKYLGYVEQAWKQYPEAIKWLGDYQKRFPEDPDTYRRLAGIYLMQDRQEEALQQLERLFALVEDEPAVAAQVGQICMEKSEWKQAASWFRKAIEIDPFDARTHAAYGEALLESGDLAAAEREFESVCTLKPEEPQGYAGLGDVFAKKGDMEKAAEYKKKAEALGAKQGPDH